MYHKLLFVFYFSFTVIIVRAQRFALGSVKEVMATVDTFNARLPSEQLYIHFDKPYYAVGDTIWLKAYLFETKTHAYSPLSGLLYIELVTGSNKIVKRLSLPVSYGISWGQVPLNIEDVPEGSYSIRAYTNWMQNFGEDYFFRQQFYVTGAGKNNWLVKEEHTIAADGDKENLAVNLQLSSADKSPIKNREVNFKIISGTRQLFKKDVETNLYGNIKEEFVLPGNNRLSRNMMIVLEDKNDASIKTNIPVQLSRVQNIDLQFMPEGGYMVSGMAGKVGFKAIAENGLGIDVSGKIVDSKNREAASFRSVYKGMGTFKMVPEEGENYFAVINQPGGSTKRYPLPAVKNSGIIMRLDNDNNDSLAFTLYCSPELVGNDNYYFLGLSRGVVCFAARFIFKTSGIHARISKKNFPSGIAHFTLMNSSGMPVNERLLFIDHSDNLRIRAATSNMSYSPRDSIPVTIKVTDRDGTPVAGSFSVAVTDDTQVKIDSVNAENIVSRMLLTGELKGNVETPGYYLSNNRDALQALDALLLTQGWIGYDWQKIFKAPAPVFLPEKYFSLSGTVTNLVNRPVSKAQVILLSTGKHSLFKDTLTDEKGHFTFSDFPMFDSLGFFVQARNAKGKSFGMGVALNEFTPPEIMSVLPAVSPWYINSDTILLNYIQNNEALGIENEKKYKRLPTVNIASKKRIKNSQNLNGPGEADQVITETEIEMESKKNLLDLLQQKVKGFRIIHQPDGSHSYKIFSNSVYMIIDGVSLNFFNLGREVLEYLDASDVTGIEVMNNSRYTSRYSSTFLSIGQQMSMNQYSFIEITTRSGNGIFMKRTPGVASYKPVPVSIPREFYSPRYTASNRDEKTTDLRSTIYWQPSVVTNEKGEATVSFYAADTPATYSIIIEGSDMQGSIGHTIQKITVK